MADGDHFASYAQARNAIGNPPTSICSDNELEEALTQSDNSILLEIDPSGNTTVANITAKTVWGVSCRLIQCDLLSMAALRMRHFKENNLAESGTVVSFFQIQPALTREHQHKIDQIRRNFRKSSYSYNTETGYRVV